MRLGGKETIKRLESSTKKLAPTIPDVQMNFLLERFMNWTRKDFRGHKAEISAHQFTRRASRFALAYGMKDSTLIWELQKRGFLEPSAADTFILRYDLVRK